MSFVQQYWDADPDAPFRTLLRMVDKYCHPEAYDEAYDDLIYRARRPAHEDPEMATFKAELSQLLQGRRDGLHPHALFTAAQYDDGSDDAFLQRLWRDLYPDEPVPAPE